MGGLVRWKANGMLIIGLLLLTVMVVLAIFGPALALYPRNFQDNIIYIEKGNEKEMLISPVRPMELFPFGSDSYGKDLFSQLMYGARYSVATVLMVSFFRITLAFLFVLLFRRGVQRRGPAGEGPGKSRGKSPLKGLNGIPQFIIIYFILHGISFNSPMSVPAMALFQWLLLIFFGFPSLVPTLAGEIAALEQQEFVTAAKSTGAGELHLLRRHILPHMKEKLLILFSQETVAVLTLVGQLGIFNIFIGGTYFTPAPPLFHSISNEWAGLVGQYRMKLQPGTWWILFFPLMGFFLLLLSLYLSSKGLERLFRDSYHKGKVV